MKNNNKTEGSVWNVNNWHWEQKNYSKEAEELLKEKISSMNFEKEGVSFSVVKITKIKGHAEISVRKGKQIVVYEYSLEADFRAEDDKNETEGHFKIVEINESDFDFEINSISITK